MMADAKVPEKMQRHVRNLPHGRRPVVDEVVGVHDVRFSRVYTNSYGNLPQVLPQV
jgi:hypothetical protein